MAIGSQAKDNHRIKADEAGRGFTKDNMEKKFGAYEKSAGKYPIEERYSLAPAKPLRTAKEKKMWRIILAKEETGQGGKL